MDGSKSIDDLGLTAYPVGYKFFSNNGTSAHLGASNIAGDANTIKNGQCVNYYAYLSSYDQQFYTGQSVTFTVDNNNQISESNENNNSFTWNPSTSSADNLNTMANTLANMQALLDEIARTISEF